MKARPVAAKKPRRGRLTALTRRRREVATLVYRGFSNRQIAEKLGVTVGTIKVHLHAIYEKLDIHTRIELASALIDRRKVYA